VVGRACHIDGEKQMVTMEGSGKSIPYDLLSCNAGSYVPGRFAFLAKDYIDRRFMAKFFPCDVFSISLFWDRFQVRSSPHFKYLSF